jgi:hypothetical protein
MNYQKYEEIWEKSIKPKIERMLSYDDDLFFTGGQIKENIWLAYENFKNKVHTYMQDPDGRIDRHKVASAMLYSIIANKPFEVKFLPLNRKLNGYTLLANETLGLHAALAIVKSFLLTDANEKCDKIKIEIFKDDFIFPECEYDDYPTHIYQMLHYAKYNNHYDIFAFSHILFLIEAYTELKRRTELAGQALAR